MGFSNSVNQLNNQNPPPPSPNGPSGGAGGKGAMSSATQGAQPQNVGGWDNTQISQMPTTIEGLYQNVLGRKSDQGGADYWKQQFGDTVDANEYQTFVNAAQPELQQRGPQGQQPSGKGGSSVNSNPGPQGMNGQVTYPGQGGQPQIGRQNPYSQTVGGWDNAQIGSKPSMGGKGKGA